MSIVRKSETLPPRDRFPAWCEMSRTTHVPTDIQSDHESNFRASVQIVPLGPLQVSVLTYPSLVAHRGRRLIRQCDPEMYLLTLDVQGRMGIGQKGREAAIDPRDMVLYHSSEPFLGWVRSGHEPCEVIQAQIPRNFLRPIDRAANDAVGTTISTVRGTAALLAQCLAGLPRHTDDLHPDIAVKLGGVVTDLLAVTIADRVGDGARRVVDARHRTLVLAIHSYIEQRLSDPDLSPSSIAAAHHMSVRSLQRVFQAQGSTVTEWIRNRRLDRCRHDLANPLLVGRSVSSIAAVWQFTSPAHFTRLFRVTYGLAPGEYRRHATSSRRRDLSRG